MLKSAHVVSGHVRNITVLTIVERTHWIHIVVPVAIRHHIGHAVHWVHAIPSQAVAAEVALVWGESEARLAHHTIGVHGAGFPGHAFVCTLHCVLYSAGVSRCRCWLGAQVGIQWLGASALLSAFLLWSDGILERLSKLSKGSFAPAIFPYLVELSCSRAGALRCFVAAVYRNCGGVICEVFWSCGLLDALDRSIRRVT
jgi:hypothetical protein